MLYNGLFHSISFKLRQDQLLNMLTFIISLVSFNTNITKIINFLNFHKKMKKIVMHHEFLSVFNEYL